MKQARRSHVLMSLVVAACLAMCGRAWGEPHVVKDHVSNSAAWAEDVGGMLDHFLDPDPAWGSAVALAFTGTGERLDKVGIIWATMSVGADLEELRWRFRFFPDPAGFALGALYSPASDPKWEATLETPSNADWPQIIGGFLGVFDYRYAEVSVGHLGITTVPGQTHLVVLVPESRLEMPQTLTAIAMSGGGAGTIGTEPDWFHRGANFGPTGPGSLAGLGENWQHAAGKVILAAAPACPEDLAAPVNAAADRRALCEAGSVQLSASPGTGGDTVEWHAGACDGAVIATGTSVAITVDATATFFAKTKHSATGCTSEACVQVGPIVLHNYAKADFDRDCDVDGEDLLMLANCASGPAVPYSPAGLPEPSPGCSLIPDIEGRIAADFDRDGDVDQVDFAAFQRCISGAWGAPAQECVEQ